MFSSLWETAKSSPFNRPLEAHCDAPNKQLVAGRNISAANSGMYQQTLVHYFNSFMLTGIIKSKSLMYIF